MEKSIDHEIQYLIINIGKCKITLLVESSQDQKQNDMPNCASSDVESDILISKSH